jgi:branched-chain amino acid transport system substrate-binding protein
VKRKRLLPGLILLAVLAAACGDDDDTAADATTTEAPAADATTTEASADGDATTTAAAGGDTTATTAGDTGAAAGGFDIDAVLATDLDACEPEPTGEPLRFGFAADLSDLGGFADGPASQAAEHFVNLINCAGGVNGTPVELTVQNIEGDPEVTQRAAQDLVDAGVQAILGPPFADFGQPLLQVTQGQVPVLFVASTEPTLPDVASLAFLVAFDDTAQATAAAQFALDQGWQNAVTFSSPGPYFGYNPEVFTEVFEAGGGTVLGDYNFVPIDDVDFSTQVNEIANLDVAPDVVYSAMLAFQAAPLAEQLAAAGVETNFLITDAFEATGGYATDGTEGFYHTTHSFPAEGSRVKALNDSFAAATGAPLENPSFGGLAADAITVVIDAYLRTGATDPAELGAAIAEGSDIEAVTGVISYDGGATPIKPVYVHQVVDGAPSLAATIGG